MKKLVAIGALAFTLSSLAAPLSVDAANYRVYSYSNNGSCNNIQNQLQNYISNGNSCTPGKIVIQNGGSLNLEDYGIKSNNSNSNCNNDTNANADCNVNNYDNSNCRKADSNCENNTKPDTIPSTEDVTPSTETPKPEAPKPETPKPETPAPTTPDTEHTTPNTENTTPAKPQTPSTDSKETKDLTFAEQVVALVNAERAKEGLSPLTIDKTLTSAAMVRAKETQSTFAHTRPNGSSFATAITEAGGTYRGAGENIAYGQKTPEAVMNAWMNSSGHRANIMNKNYTKIGVGYLTSSSNVPYWVQLFSY